MRKIAREKRVKFLTRCTLGPLLDGGIPGRDCVRRWQGKCHSKVSKNEMLYPDSDRLQEWGGGANRPIGINSTGYKS